VLQVLQVASAVGVALVYFVIAAMVVPRIGLGTASRRFVLAVRIGGTLFFVGCGLTHLHIAAHALGAQPAAHEIGFHMLQLVGGWVFVLASLRYLNIRVEPRERESQLRKLEELERLSMRDPLTGAYNRRYLSEALGNEISRQRRHGAPVSVIYIDLDDFKTMNALGGHAYGDEVLRMVAMTAGKAARPSDSVIRLGGDEFVVLLPETDRTGALAAAERLRESLAKVRVGAAVGISASFGIASCPEDARDAISLLELADSALFRAKEHGKDAVMLAEPATLPEVQPRQAALPASRR
jgi:diguanylate cyclase (GGDEF)-like protein